MAARLAEICAELGLEPYFERIAASELTAGYLAQTTNVTRSRFRGPADLPPSLIWPNGQDGRPLAFALQIDLEELPIQLQGFPSAGLVSWFVAAHEDEPTVAFVVTPPGIPTIPCVEPEDVPPGFLSDAEPCSIEVIAAPDTPRWATSDYLRMTRDMSEAEEAGYEQLAWRLEPADRVVLGRLLGHAAGIGVDPREDAATVRDLGAPLLDWGARAQLSSQQIQQWRHFLTLESTRALRLTICDAGYLQVLVRDEDLSRMDFNHVWADVQSS